MDKPSTSKFFIGSLVTFFILFLITQAILASALSAGKGAVKPESMADSAVAQRIEPVAHVYIGEPPVVEVEAEELSPGEQVVKQVCARCHRSGLMKSPKLGKASDWAPRIEKGMDTLYKHALNGFNKMPARGGRKSLSDDKVIAAVDFIVQELK